MDFTTYPLQAALRVGDAERQDAAAQLQTHFAAGRLTWDELDDRLGQAYAARTEADLKVLFTDLPAPQVQPPVPVKAPRLRTRISPVFVLLALVILLVVTAVVVTGGFILLPVALWFIAGSTRHRHRFAHGHGRRHIHGHGQHQRHFYAG